MTEVDVTITDYLLSLLGGYLALKSYKFSDSNLRKYSVLFFISISIAALLGGSVHGFFPDSSLLIHKVLWKSTLLCIGLTALSGHELASVIYFKRDMKFLWLIFFAYVITVLFFYDNFLLAILFYLPVLIIFALVSFRVKKGKILGAAVLVTLIATSFQALKIDLHPTLLTHAAIYHLIQLGGLALFYRAFYEFDSN